MREKRPDETETFSSPCYVKPTEIL